MLVEGRDVAGSSVVQSQDTREYKVELHFDKRGTEKFAKATEDNLGRNIGIYMDDTRISNPVVQQKIEGGEAVINGMGSREEAQALSDKINAGALPFSMKTSNYNTISPHWKPGINIHGDSGGSGHGSGMPVHELLLQAARRAELCHAAVSDGTAGAGYLRSPVYHHTSRNCGADPLGRHGSGCQYYHK